MGFNISKLLPPIMDYNSLNQQTGGIVTSWNPNLPKYPKPPRKRKREIYDPAKYKDLNEHIENTPQRLVDDNVKNLVQYLIKSCTNDLAKVYTLFYWITSQSFSVNPQKKPKKYSATWYLNKIFTGQGNFAHFFYILCWYAEIPCVIIGGTTKNSAYKIGFPFVTADMEAQWNAVYVEDDWRLISIQWACIYVNATNEWKTVVAPTDEAFSSQQHGATCPDSGYDNPNIPSKPKTKREYFHHVNDYYFLTDPKELIWTHFPNRKKWQLLDNPVTLEEFLSHFYVREYFYLLGMSLTENSQTDCVLLLDEYRRVRIEFDLPPECSSTYRFKYTLSHHWSVWTLEKQESLLQLGKYEVKDDRFYLNLHFTSKGIYKLDIFGSESENCEFYLVCSYVIKCSYTEEGPALPWKFFLGYGSGIKPLKKKVQTNDGRIKLQFPIERDATIMHILCHEGRVVEGCSLLRMLDDDNISDMVTMIIELRLPETGKYSLNVYQNKNAARRDLCVYCIIYDKDTETSAPELVGSTDNNSSESQKNKIIVLSHPGSFIQTNLNSLKILFRSKHQLRCKLFPNFYNTGVIKNPSILHDMVTKECQFNVNISTSGDYTLKIFAKISEETVLEANASQYYELHSYKIRKQNSENFSISGLHTNQDSSVYIVGTFETYHSLINISQMDFTNQTLLVVQYQNESSVSRKQVNVVDVEEKLCVQVALPQIGDYLLSLLQRDSETGLVKKVTRYLIRRKQFIEENNGDKNNNLQLESQVNCTQSDQDLNQREHKKEKIIKIETQTPTKTIDPSNTKAEKTEKKVDLKPAKRELMPIHTESIKKEKIESVDIKHPNKNNKFDFIPYIDKTNSKTNEHPKEVDELSEKNVASNISNQPKKENQNDKANSPEFSDFNLLHELEYAISKRNPKLLKSVLSRSKKHMECDIVKLAKNLLDMLLAKSDLVQAYGARDKDLLETALQNAQRVNFDDELNEEITVAHSLYQRLCEIENLRFTIGAFDYRAVSEIKSYSNPPKAVIAVMRSVFLILNVPENDVLEWKQIRSLMRNIQNPFLRRILNCSPRFISLESVKAAERNLGILKSEDISCVSEMAKVLFTWVKKMIEEAKNQELNIDLANINHE